MDRDAMDLGSPTLRTHARADELVTQEPNFYTRAETPTELFGRYYRTTALQWRAKALADNARYLHSVGAPQLDVICAQRQAAAKYARARETYEDFRRNLQWETEATNG